MAPSRPAHSRVTGRLPASTRMSILVALNSRDPAALASYASAVSTPGSSVFHHFLTVPEFRARFAPRRGQIAAVVSSLRSHGLATGSVMRDGLFIPVTASAGRLAAAFGTSFMRVKLASGRTAFANTRAPLFDASVAGLVQTVAGLDTLVRPHRLSAQVPRRPRAGSVTAAPKVVTGGPQPCADASNSEATNGGYTADELANAYNFDSLYQAGDLGAGVRVALYELEPNLPSDIQAYQSCYGTHATVNYITVGSSGPLAPGPGSGEAAGDIEDVIGLVPDATIDVYQTDKNFIGDPYVAIANADVDKIVETSWGIACEPDEGVPSHAFDHTVFQQMAVQGQTMFVASGDYGSDACVPYGEQRAAANLDSPTSDPFVTAVGGLTLSSSSYPPEETVWNDSATFGGAGNGGISILWPMPSYQADAPASLNVININSAGTLCAAPAGSYCREVPDVSAAADEDYVFYFNGGWSVWAGTSFAAPLWAAFTALVDASSGCAGKPIGFANPLLYQAAADGYSNYFTDVTTGNTDYTPTGYTGGLYPAGPGYDMASGLGSMNGATLPAALCGVGPTTVTVTNPGNQNNLVHQAASLQIAANDSLPGEPLVYSATGLPSGLSINSSSGLITGTLNVAGTSSVKVTVRDTNGAVGTASFTWRVNGPVGIATIPQPATATVGSSIADKATVSGGINPTGTVTFNLYNNPNGTGPALFTDTETLVNGTAISGGYTAMGTGTDYWVATYNGDPNNNPVTSGTALEPVTISPADQTITVDTHAPANAAFGTQFTVAAHAVGGPVAYSSAGSCSNTGATFTITSAGGSCSVMYDQPGNGNYNAAPQVVETVTAQKADQTITVDTHAPASAVFGTQFTVAADAPGGSTSYSSSGSCSNSGATFTITSGTGVCTVMYDQVGNDDYNAAPEVVETVTAQKANQTITVDTHAPAGALFNTQFTGGRARARWRRFVLELGCVLEQRGDVHNHRR